MKWRTGIVVLGMAAALVQSAQATDYVQTIGGNAYTWKDFTYLGVPGRLYVPPTYNPSTPSPMVMFLHGLGEGGTDNESQISTHMSNLLVNARNRNYILFAPQAGANQWWPELDKTVRAVGKLATTYNIDPGRVYVTGLSAGAYGTLQANRRYSSLFAAYVPLSMAGDSFGNAADAATGVGRPMWFYAGGASGDGSFAALARKTVTSILQAHSITPPVMPSTGAYSYVSPDGQLRYTQIAGGGHDDVTWNNGAYADSNMYNWMLGQKNTITAPAVGKAVRVSFGDTGTAQPLGRTDSQGRQWNVPDAYPIQSQVSVVTTFALDETGARTTATLEVTKPFYAVSNPATTALPAGAPFDANVGKSYWRIYRDNINSGQLTFRGLTPGGEYDLELFASLATALGNTQYIGVYSVGADSVTINAGNNTSLYTLSNLTAGPAGDLVLDVNIKSGALYAILNNVSLRAVPEPTSVAAFGAAAAILLGRRRTRA